MCLWDLDRWPIPLVGLSLDQNEPQPDKAGVLNPQEKTVACP
jgi:hypothetical protein